MVSDTQLVEFARMSARIGQDELLVQGPGGNTSIKDADELWVKASGVWLAEALERRVFVPLSRSALAEARARDYAIAPEAVIGSRNPGKLRPSIETALHELMPHAVVVHAHAANAMAMAIRGDGEREAGRRLAGLRWAWIGYHQPGAALARAVDAALEQTPADIILLQNHGLVVGADTPAEAEALLSEVERRLAVEPRSWPAPDTAALASLADDVFEPHDGASALAGDVDAVALLTGQALVPDQVVFLGGAVPVLPLDMGARKLASEIEERTGVLPALLLVPGHGALAARSRSAGAESLIRGLVEIARRIPRGSSVTGLSPDDVATLLGWDAEHHRQAMDRARARG